VFYLIVSAIIIALTVSNFTVIRADIRAQRKHIYMLSRRLDMQLLREMCADKGGAGGVTELDFVLFMLVNTKGLDLKRDIEPLRKVSEKRGVLTHDAYNYNSDCTYAYV
jgi:hypothetical protein